MAYQQLFRVLPFLAGQDVVKKHGYLRARRLIVAQDAERLLAVGVVRSLVRDDGDADAVSGIHVLRDGHDRLRYVERLCLIQHRVRRGDVTDGEAAAAADHGTVNRPLAAGDGKAGSVNAYRIHTGDAVVRRGSAAAFGGEGVPQPGQHQ